MNSLLCWDFSIIPTSLKIDISGSEAAGSFVLITHKLPLAGNNQQKYLSSIFAYFASLQAGTGPAAPVSGVHLP